MNARQNPTPRNERDANAELADNSTGGAWFGVNQPPREVRGVPGGGITRAVVAVVIVGACAAIVFGWPR